MTAGLIVSLLLKSALRSALLGGAVWLLLKAPRIRDVHTETAIWILVLLAAIAMPFLGVWAPAGVPLPMPHLDVGLLADRAQGADGAPSDLPLGLRDALRVHVGEIALAVYGLIAGGYALRLCLGLHLIVGLYGRSQPVQIQGVGRRAVRMSSEIATPLSFANRILLPADYQEWPTAKLAAVLAHEQAHIRRGDFFIQLLAGAYRAAFWFNPFAWWLQHKLGDLAEAASDRAAIYVLGDAAGYAEILVEVARENRRVPLALAMARGSGVTKRVERILSGPPEQALGVSERVVVLAGVLAVSALIAQARAETPTRTVNHPHAHASSMSPTPWPQAALRASSRHAAPARLLAHRGSLAAAARPPAEADFTYNPHALIDDPTAAVLPALVRVGAAGDTPANASIIEAAAGSGS